MRSPKIFQRILPTASTAIPILLGGDASPPTQGKPSLGQDNVLYGRSTEVTGVPVTGVAVYFAGPSAASLSAQLYVYDDALAEKAQGNTGATGWVALGAAQTITPGKVFFFAPFAPLQNVQALGMTTGQGGVPIPAGQGGAVGDASYMLVVGAGASVAGTYTFCMTPVLSIQGA
jgi:hypothetical protein